MYIDCVLELYCKLMFCMCFVKAPGQHPPPQTNAPVYQTAPLSYPIYPGSAAPQPYGFSSPAPFQPYPQNSSPYPSANPAPGGYPQHSTPYPGSSIPAGSAYATSNPPTGGYPSMTSHYPPTSSPYPSGNPPTSSPYPQSSPYPSGNSSPYSASPYPSGSAPAPYQQQQTSHQASAAHGSHYPGGHGGGQTSYPGVGRAEPGPLYAQVPPLTSHSSAKTVSKPQHLEASIQSNLYISYINIPSKKLECYVIVVMLLKIIKLFHYA